MDPAGALLEAIVHALEGEEELREVLEELQPEDAVGQLEGEGAGPRGHLEGELAGGEVGPEEPAQDARVEEAHQAVGGLEEVEGVAGGRGVEDHEVPALVRRQLQQLLHRHVLVAAGQGGGGVAVEAVLEDAARGGLVGGVAGDELVEGALHVEDHGPELARRRHSGTGGESPRPAREPPQPEAGGEAPRGVDGAHQDPAAAAGGAQREGGGGGGLAHAPGAADDEDPALGQGAGPAPSRGGGVGGAIRRPRGGRRGSGCRPGPRLSRKRKGSDATGTGSPRRRRPW